MNELLTWTSFTTSTGMRTLKRPGVDYFLEWAVQSFGEVVLFSDGEPVDTEPLVAQLERRQPFFRHKLYKRSMVSRDGEMYKDLSRLNRDLSKVIVVDTRPQNYALQPANGVQIPAWRGEADDRALIDLIPFLHAVVDSKTADVRSVLPKFSGTDNAGRAFVEAQERRAALRQPVAAPAGQQPQSAVAAAPAAAPAAQEGGMSVLGVRLW